MSNTPELTSTDHESIATNIPVAIEFGKLRRSKMNMRTISPKNSPEDRELLASIRAKGIIQNLCAYPVGDTYEVPAGGRRFGALEYLLKKGEITTEFPVYCLLISEDEATDTSLIENFQRLAPHPADVYSAFSELLAQGRTVSSIAKTQGISETQVEKYLRLGNVHNVLFKLFRKDKLSFEQMVAFASTADKKLQLATFKAIGENCDARPHYIRDQLQASRQSSDSALVKFVTLEAYQEKGGATEQDLFADCTMLCDVELLVTLAEEKLQKAADSINGWKWVSTSMEGSHSLYHFHQLPSKTLPTPKAAAEEERMISDRIEDLENTENDDFNEELDREYEALESRLDILRAKIDKECTVYSEDDMPYGGCVVTFNQQTGELEIHTGLMTDEDLKGFQSKDTKTEADSETQTDKPNANAKPEISSRLSYDLGLYRRSIIKAELAKNPKIATDLLHFQTCVSVLGKPEYRWLRTLDMSFSTVCDESSIGDYRDTVAAKSLDATHAKLDIGWLSLKSEHKQFESFRALSTAKKQALVSYCVALQLLSGSTKPGKDKLIESIITELGVSFKDLWHPCADNYFSRLTIPLLLALGKRLRGAAWSNSHANDSKKSLVESFQQLFHGSDDSLSDKEKAVRTDWIPPEIGK